ncbi:hypothetical protein GX865_04210 [Candidatus Saccharibacteria bacterium]|jgi:hypothetical protein|nr:hypothetical protein [Candidatus Saccharibacteria bacterium]
MIKKLFIIAGVSFLIATISPFSSSAHAQACGDGRLLTAPMWYRGVAELDSEGNCNIKIENAGSNDDLGGSIGPFLIVVGLNVTEIMMHLASYVAVAYIIVGGFKFMTSAGSADRSVRARKTIINAVVGLVISISAIAVISFISVRIT